MNKPAIGDIVHIKAVVRDIVRHNTEVTGYYCNTPGGSVHFAINPSEIVHIEPKPLAVGDTVKSFNYLEHAEFKILAIINGKAWLERIDSLKSDVVEPLDRLQRIE